ncbi:MAG: NnrS family protein [Hyphomicrobiales bacterium]|nr:NnrS family protein [Hyphomicrobiales bacterium]
MQCRALHPLLTEGLGLFFPAAALHAVVSPLIWVALLGFVLPFAHAIPSSQWHAHEMIFGTYGAALAGFLTSAVPEWTDTPPRQGRALLFLLALWLPGRIVGLLGMDVLVLLAAVTDAAFLGLLLWYVSKPLLERRSTQHASFVAWVALLAATEIAVRWAWVIGMTSLAERLLQAALMIFLALFSLALARINVVVINLALDPTGQSTPYRPHPGRRNLTAGLVSIYAVAALALPQSTVPTYLALAAAAAFLDRLAEWFIGAAVFRMHVLALAMANLLAGAGFLLIGLSGLGVSISKLSGIHLLSVGSLGLAVISVLIIAGLRHTGRPLTLPWQGHVAVIMMTGAGLVRALPELAGFPSFLGAHYLLSAALWSGAFAVWLTGFVPLLLHPLDDAASAHSGQPADPVPSMRPADTLGRPAP